jgi:serine/threonine protein kinase
MTRDNSLMRCVLTDAAAAEMEKRYEHRHRLWLDGPYGGSVAFDKVMEREVGLYIAYTFSDIPAFIRQAKIRGRLRHPHLLPVFDLGTTADNLPYFTEPYVEASPLDLLSRTSEGHLPFSLPQLVRAVIGICRAVAHAHENGACHLDLQPSTVRVNGSRSDVFLTGGWEEIAGAAPADQNQLPGGISCTLAYAAPEQVRFSEPELVQRGLGQRVDVYGLGGILYWVLYDIPPNPIRSGAGSSVTDALQQLVNRHGPPRSRQLRPAFNAGESKAATALERIALRALHSDPLQRYPTVNDVIAELDEWLRHDQDRRPRWKFW